MDIEKFCRRCRVALNAESIPRRSEEDLEFFDQTDVAGERIMLDTCVWIDQLQAQLPEQVEERILARTVVHSPVVLGELSFLIGRLDPRHVDTSKVILEINKLLLAVPDHRIMSMTHEDAIRGNILAGCISRHLNYPPESQRKIKNDAILAAHAARLGCLLVTRNISDFDRLSQIEPKLRVTFYRT